MPTIEDVIRSEDGLSLVKVLAEQSPIGVQVYDAKGYSLYVNEIFKRTFGVAPPPSYWVLKDEIVRELGNIHLVEKAFSGISTVAPPFWYDARQLQELTTEDVEHVQKHGKKCAIQTHHIPVFNQAGEVTHVVFFHKDVTGELYMQKERDDARALIQNILDQTKVIVHIKDLDGKFIFANAQFCRVFDLSQEKIIGKTNRDLFPKEIADHLHKNDLHVQETLSQIEFEENVIHSDGTTHSYLSLKFPLHDSNGNLYATSGISTDITQYRRAEQEMIAAKRIQTVGLLASGVAHNFNNLLEIILLISDTLLLKKNQKKADWQGSLRSIKDAVQSASMLTRQLLAFGRQQNYQPCLLDLVTTLSGMKEILRYALRDDIVLSIKTEPDIWPIHVDPLQVEQVLTNLCLNARDAMPGGGSLEVRVQNACLSPDLGQWRVGKPSGDYVELRISDNGSGMRQETLDRIFEPFFTTKTDGKGTGLGLATVYGIIQSAGGDIAVESKPGAGTVFRVYFPRARGANIDLAHQSVEPRKGNETILLVEDQGMLRHITAGLLRDHGYTVIESRDAKSALELWPMISKRVDLILTDVVMPEMSGIELIQEIARTTRRPLNVLFVSAYSKGKSQELNHPQIRALFLEKPFSAYGLFQKLREALTEPRKARKRKPAERPKASNHRHGQRKLKKRK